MLRTLRIEGEMTIAQAAGLREQLLACLRGEGHGLSLDLGEVELIDSAGIQLLLATRRTLAEREAELQIERCAPVVHDALRVYGLQALAAVATQGEAP